MKFMVLRAFSFLATISILQSAAPAADNPSPPPRLTVELRDGSHVVGASVETYFKFRSALQGEIKLDVKDIRSVDCIATNSARLTTANGDTLTVSFADSALAVQTGFGKLELAVDSIRKFTVSATEGSHSPPATARVARAADTNLPPRLTIELRDGSQVIGTGVEDYFKFHSELQGEIKLAVKDIRSVDCVATNSAKLTTANGDTLTVSLVDSVLAVKTSFGKVELSVDSIRRVKVSAMTPSASGPIFNIDFGPGRADPTKQTGAAAVGQDGDFWNSASIGFNNDHTESGLKFANGEPSPIAVQFINLGGGWGNDGKMGVKAPMLNSFNYPVNNQGGNSRVILYHVPPGTYALYVYGHGVPPLYYGDYAVAVAGRDYGRKQTTTSNDAVENTDWVEGSQYVKFPAVVVAESENLGILIRPGGPTGASGGRVVSDAMICGLQLVPVH